MGMDVYVLTRERSLGMASRFIDRFAHNMEEGAEEYEFPQYADAPEIVYATATDLIARLVSEPRESHSVYWRPSDADARVSGAMLFFTTDNAMIVGVTVETEDVEELKTSLTELAEHMDASVGCVLWETPPPDTAREFRDVVRTSEWITFVRP